MKKRNIILQMNDKEDFAIIHSLITGLGGEYSFDSFKIFNSNSTGATFIHYSIHTSIKTFLFSASLL